MARLALLLALLGAAACDDGAQTLAALPDDDGAGACSEGPAGAAGCPALSMRQLRGELQLGGGRGAAGSAGGGRAGGAAGLLEVLTVPAGGRQNVSADALLAQLAERLGASARGDGTYGVACERAEALPQLVVLAEGSSKALALAGRDFLVKDGVGGCHLAARGLGCSLCKSFVDSLGIVGATGACMTACHKAGISWNHICGAACAAIEAGICHGSALACSQVVCEKINLCDAIEDPSSSSATEAN